MDRALDPAKEAKRLEAEEIAELAAAIARHHITASLWFGIPELRLTTEPIDEGMILARAWHEANKHYGIKVPPRLAATMELVAAVSIVYKPRLGLLLRNARQATAHAREQMAKAKAEAIKKRTTDAAPEPPTPEIVRNGAGDAIITTGTVIEYPGDAPAA